MTEIEDARGGYHNVVGPHSPVPYVVIESAPRGHRGVCTSCVNSLWYEIGWPRGDHYWKPKAWPQDTPAAVIANAYQDFTDVYVTEIRSKISDEHLARAKEFFLDPAAPEDTPAKHDHRMLFRRIVEREAEQVRAAVQFLKNVERGDEKGEWITKSEVSEIITRAIDEAREDAGL